MNSEISVAFHDADCVPPPLPAERDAFGKPPAIAPQRPGPDSRPCRSPARDKRRDRLAHVLVQLGNGAGVCHSGGCRNRTCRADRMRVCRALAATRGNRQAQ